MRTKSVALVHDWLTGYRGGEKVLEGLCDLFPESPIYTLFYRRGSLTPRIENHPIHTSFLNRMPGADTYYRHYLPLFPLAAEVLLPSGFDLIVSTSHAVAKSVRTRGAKHWCYLHTPMRYVWDRFDDYFGPDKVGWLPSTLLFRPVCKAIQIYDRATVSRVHRFVANSRFVRDRVRRFYHVDCEVIHPPVDTERFQCLERKPEDFYLFFSALVPYKKADQAIQACQNLKRRLKVVGRGPELARLKALADPKYIEFHENPTDEEVDSFYSRARGMIFPGVEDFGIVLVEASAAGLPVIGFGEGGILDSQDEDTCVFYDQQTVEGLSRALQEFENRTFDPARIRRKAERFGRARFIEELRNSIQNV